MTFSPVHGRGIAAALAALGVALAVAPAASADPAADSPPDPSALAVPAPAPEAAVADIAPPTDDGGSASVACKQFSVALNYAAANYEDFAYNSAGGGNVVNYADPTVQNSNVVGRTALREAAATALNASMTPGLQPDISSPMQSWSLRATKLVLIMGLRGGGDSLNATATNLNTDAHDVQMACAAAGTPA
jgi:hypothetical protein